MTFFDNILQDEHLMIRQTCKQFAQEFIAPHAIEWEEAEMFPRELYAQAAAAGILGIGFPVDVGGCGGGALHMVMGVEGLMEGGSTGVVVGLGTAGIALPPIVRSGNANHIERFVRPVLCGEKVASLTVTEPNAGSDVTGIRTSATRNGDYFIVRGNKQFITSGARADVFTTLVRTGDDPHGGLSFLIIERSMDGVSVSRPLKKTGWRASDTVEISFDDVRVPVSHLIGDEGGAFVVLMQNFQMERLALAAYGLATARIALREACAYARERHAFGKPLTGFQVTRHKIADMSTRVLAIQALVYQVASRMDDGEEVVAEVSMAKNMAAEAAVQICYDAVQIFGGMGYMRETWVERLSRDARLLPIGGGTQEIMKEIIAQRLGI